MTAKWKIHYLEDLSLGMRASITRTLTEEDVAKFADVSGDHNPIHLDKDFAAGSLFGQRIGHGMFTASLFSAVIGMTLPGPGAVYLNQTLSFKAPVLIGDVIVVTVEVAELTEKGNRCKLHCEATVAGKVVLEGEALVKVPSRAAKA